MFRFYVQSCSTSDSVIFHLNSHVSKWEFFSKVPDVENDESDNIEKADIFSVESKMADN